MPTPATIRTVQLEIDRRGIPVEFVRGDGYHYFIYDGRGPNYETESVMVPYTSHQSVARWVEDAEQAHAAIVARLESRK